VLKKIEKSIIYMANFKIEKLKNSLKGWGWLWTWHMGGD